MIRTESDLWARLRPALDAHGFFWERIEDRTRSGIPDVYMGAPGVRVWVELKVDRLAYRSGQLPWALRADKRCEPAVTLLAKDGRLFLYHTAAIARAELFDAPRPDPIWTGSERDIDAAIAACFGVTPCDVSA